MFYSVLFRFSRLAALWGFLCYSPALISQCSIPWNTICIDNVQICALADINGISCSSLTYANVPACPTICGAPVNNILYLPFLSQGGQVTVEMTVSNCSLNGTGLEMAITNNCSCSPIICQTSCNGPGVYSMSANLPACKYLFLMIDGCGGDICDFELNCTGPGAQRPELTYLSPIIGKQLVCQGACSESYSIQLTHGCGSVMRKWTLDGTTIGSNSNNVKIDFPEAGEFDLCVDVDYSLISLGGSCVQTQQKCMQIKVIKNPDRMGGIRYLCPETKPFLWHNQFIYDSDIYRAEFTGSGCCKFDSVVEFNYLDEPVSPIIYHLSCTPLDSFVDPVSGRSFKTCQNMQPVYLRKSSMPYRCDSLYFLNAAFLDYKLSVSELCQDSLILSAQLKDQSDSCIVPWFKTDIGFKWYMGNDSLRKTISQDTFLRIRESGEFCLEMTARSEFGQKVHECVYQYCRQIQMEDFIPDPVCPFGFSGGHPFYDSYTIELSELPASARNHRWRIEGGTIQSPGHGDDSTTLWVDWDPKASEGKVCYRYANDCFESKECCISVRLISGQTDGYRLDWLKVTPNPFREEFKIWLNLELKLLDLYILDPYGKKIQQNLSYKRVLNGSLSISSSDMRPGVYYLCAETDRGLLVRKVVKL